MCRRIPGVKDHPRRSGSLSYFALTDLSAFFGVRQRYESTLTAVEFETPDRLNHQVKTLRNRALKISGPRSPYNDYNFLKLIEIL
jgi:hypothetical protein